jgi:hypothetical protein
VVPKGLTHFFGHVHYQNPLPRTRKERVANLLHYNTPFADYWDRTVRVLGKVLEVLADIGLVGVEAFWIAPTGDITGDRRH